jgi:Ni/Fe-hydrogenase subunit HybB-like protein
MNLLPKLSAIMVWVFLTFFVVRHLDLLRVGGWPLAFAGDVPALSFWVEFLLGVAAIATLLPKASRMSPRYVFLGATFMLLNGFLYRLNCYLIGYDPGAGWQYFPSAGEILVTLGIFALHAILYLVFVKQLPVLHAVRRGVRHGMARAQ